MSGVTSAVAWFETRQFTRRCRRQRTNYAPARADKLSSHVDFEVADAVKRHEMSLTALINAGRWLLLSCIERRHCYTH